MGKGAVGQRRVGLGARERSGGDEVMTLLRFVCVLSLALVASIATAAESTEPVTASEMTEIRQAFQAVGLQQADLARGTDGRVMLIGEYENRDQVETAFAAARAVVGLRRVAPTTPAQIKYRLKGFQDSFSSKVGRMMRKPDAAKTPPPAATP